MGRKRPRKRRGGAPIDTWIAEVERQQLSGTSAAVRDEVARQLSRGSGVFRRLGARPVSTAPR